MREAKVASEKLRSNAFIFSRNICFSFEFIPDSDESMVRRLLTTGKRAKPQNYVDMRLGDGWHKRNFLAEVIIPSLFTRRHGHRIKPVFPELLQANLRDLDRSRLLSGSNSRA